MAKNARVDRPGHLVAATAALFAGVLALAACSSSGSGGGTASSR
jgi:hypothetical protein